MQQHSRYIDLTTDYGFKRIFGRETNKDLLMSFLNELFQGRKVIKDLVYNKNEHSGDIPEQGAVIFDLTCTADDDSQFIIEVQRRHQELFKQRTIYYGAKLISDQAPKGHRSDWGYDITEVYVIAIMDGFHFSDKPDYLHDICLCHRKTGEIFYDKLGFIYLELLNFNKPEEQLTTDLERWLFVLKNMAKLDKLSPYLRKPIFEKLFSIAEYTRLNKEEKDMYDVSLKRKWDEYSLLTSAETRGIRQGLQQGLEQGLEQGIQQGIQQGIEQGRLNTLKENARNMLNRGFNVQLISEVLGLSVDEIKSLMN
ncbi:Rpn family recombination-promoting nuclease/putative transposase [Lonepinella sp. BR2474]|uniref:Rpn family recombination-promoting nuclease/putative transposase n=1 Tax=Lonepinella sp. BR2474 TaxID=3434548 RepID=UPI003F6E022E